MAYVARTPQNLLEMEHLVCWVRDRIARTCFVRDIMGRHELSATLLERLYRNGPTLDCLCVW